MTTTERSDLRLQVTPIPKPLYALNLRTALKSGWQKIRQAELQRAGSKCETCRAGITSGLHAHEEWHYDTAADPAIARISRIVIQCRMCHDVEHFFRTFVVIKSRMLLSRRINELIEHFCRVNRVGPEEFNRHAVAAWNEWVRLSQLNWRVEFQPFTDQSISAKAVTDLKPLTPDSRLPWVDADDYERHSIFLSYLTKLSTAFGCWIGSPSKGMKLPLHDMEPGAAAGEYTIIRTLELSGGESHTLSWSDDPIIKAHVQPPQKRRR